MLRAKCPIRTVLLALTVLEVPNVLIPRCVVPNVLILRRGRSIQFTVPIVFLLAPVAHLSVTLHCIEPASDAHTSRCAERVYR